MIVGVVGVPRTGTSLLGQILEALGVCMGTELLAGDKWNPDGYSVDVPFAAAVDGFFQSCFPSAVMETDLTSALAGMTAYTASRGGNWGVKEHRLSLIWRHFVSCCSEQPVVIFTSRSLASSAASWAARSADPAFSGGALGQTTTVDRAMTFLSNFANAVSGIQARWRGRSLTVDFESLLANPASGVQAIADFVGVPVTEAAVAAVKPSYRNF